LPLDEEDFVPDLAQRVRVESESTVERRRVQAASRGQQLSVLETVRASDALADDDAERVRPCSDVAGITTHTDLSGNRPKPQRKKGAALWQTTRSTSCSALSPTTLSA